MKERDLKDRTKSFALRIIRLYTALPRSAEAQVMGKQFFVQERLSEHITMKLSVQSLMLISSVKSKKHCKNWKRPFIG
jgi:hypothetical protein